jgi:excisionase family DNA binding protein
MLKRPDMVEPVVSVAAAPESVSVATAAMMIGVSERLIEQLIASGELPSFKIRNRRLITVQAIKQFVADAQASGQT